VNELPLRNLRPGWVEFSGTKGVMRVLRANESSAKAAGVIFICPTCHGAKDAEHFCIFLFDLPDVPHDARPHGRFKPTLSRDKTGASVPSPFTDLSLQQVQADGKHSLHLAPQDLPCRWEGAVLNGVVTWK
jgi:hypothetical protein